MPKFEVSKSIEVTVALDKAKEVITNFETWIPWSPWLIIEPNASKTFNDKQGLVGASYAWDGELVGAGNMDLVAIEGNHIAIDVHFTKPWKSESKVSFDLSEKNGVTTITWNMVGSLPFFMFWMKKMMISMLGRDYERGLRMLKEYLEEGKVYSVVQISENASIEAQNYIGVKTACSMSALSENMDKDFATLFDFVAKSGVQTINVPFSITQKFDMVKEEIEYVVAIAYEGEVAAAEGMITGRINAGAALEVTHTGRYHHLGNAWTAAMQYSRTKKIKTSTNPYGYEFYMNDPHETPAEELIAKILLPLR